MKHKNSNGGLTTNSLNDVDIAIESNETRRAIRNDYSLLRKEDILNNSCYKILAATMSFEECINILLRHNAETDTWLMAMKAFTFHFLNTKGRKTLNGIDALFDSINARRDEFIQLINSGKLTDLNCENLQSYSEKTKLHITHLHPILEHNIFCGYEKIVFNSEAHSSSPYFTVDLTPLTIDFYSSFLKENMGVIDSKVYENLLRTDITQSL